MAEAVLFNIAGRILGNLGSLALQESGLRFAVRGELSKLENTISTIRDVLLDAEEQYQKSDPSHQIRGWLAKLKDAVYEADDANKGLFFSLTSSSLQVDFSAY